MQGSTFLLYSSVRPVSSKLILIDLSQPRCNREHKTVEDGHAVDWLLSRQDRQARSLPTALPILRLILSKVSEIGRAHV